MTSNLERDLRRYFEEEYAYRTRSSKDGFHHQYDAAIFDLAKRFLSRESMVLEIGGGSGYKLGQIATYAGIENLCNCELVAKVYRQQDNPAIKLVAGNVLNLPFKDEAFDFLMAVNLIHHLAGPTRRQSMKNQGRAFSEMLRVLQPDGILVIGEICYHSRLVCTIIHRLCFVANQMDVQIRGIGVKDGLIVNFLTNKELCQLAKRQDCVDSIVSQSFKHTKDSAISVPTALSLLLSDNMLLICRKSKGPRTNSNDSQISSESG